MRMLVVKLQLEASLSCHFVVRLVIEVMKAAAEAAPEALTYSLEVVVLHM